MKKKILVIIGSASSNSANLKLIQNMESWTPPEFELTIFNELKTLPPFDPEQSLNNPPEIIEQFRNSIAQADGIIICTPEYIFSIPSGLKNAIEWCIATTVFSSKPCGLITASASGLKGHEELQLIMKTAMATFTEETALLIQGIKGKFDEQGKLVDVETIGRMKEFLVAFRQLLGSE